MTKLKCELGKQQRNFTVDDKIILMKDYERTYASIFNHSKFSADEDAKRVAQFVNKYPSKFNQNNAKTQNLSELVDEAAQYEKKLVSLKNLTLKYKHKYDEHIKDLIEEYDPMRRLGLKPNESPNKKDQTKYKTDLEKLIENYKIQLELKPRLLKEAVEIYPHCKHNQNGFYDYKKGIFKRDGKALLQKEAKEGERRRLFEELKRFSSSKRRKTTKKKSKTLQSSFQNLNAIEAELKLSRESSLDIIPQQYKDQVQHSFILRNSVEGNETRNSNTMMNTRNQYYTHHGNSQLKTNQSTLQSKSALSNFQKSNHVRVTENILGMSPELSRMNTIFNQSQLANQTKITNNIKSSTLQKNLEKLETNKNHLKSLINACTHPNYPLSEEKAQELEKDYLKKLIANEIKDNHISTTIGILQEIEYADDPRKVQQLYQYLNQSEKDYHEEIEQCRNDYRKGGLDSIASNLKMDNKKKKPLKKK